MTRFSPLFGDENAFVRALRENADAGLNVRANLHFGDAACRPCVKAAA
jgi:hypothetical protein